MSVHDAIEALSKMPQDYELVIADIDDEEFEPYNIGTIERDAFHKQVVLELQLTP